MSTPLSAAFDRHALVSISDRAGDITYANEKFCNVSGYAASELLGRNHRIQAAMELAQARVAIRDRCAEPEAPR